MSLQSRNAVITGSTSGIGLAMARALAKEGVNITLNGLGDAGEIARLTEAMAKEFGVKVRYSPANMLDGAAIATMIMAISICMSRSNSCKNESRGNNKFTHF
jgi:3-hydroxybutyrate dehydrogenase